MSPKRIDTLTDAQRARMDGWADRWIEVGLRTGPADRERFEAAAADCYRYAGIPWPGVVVWVSSPLVMALAGPTAALSIELIERRGAVDGAVRDAVRGAVDGAVGDAVHDAVRGAVGGAVGGAVDGAVGDAVHDAVRGAVGGAVGGAVDGAVGDAVHDAVRGAVDGAEITQAVAQVISRCWHYRLGGQFWAGGWWGPAYTSFFRDVCGLELDGDLWGRGRAYEATVESACWWWPHRRFVMVCERPTVIHRELVDPDRPRGWGSHRLHCDDGPAVVWPDGWGVYAVHGVRVPARVVLDPGSLVVADVLGEENQEVRRVMAERIGWDRFVAMADLRVVDEAPDPANPGHMVALYDLPEQIYDEPVRLVLVTNASPERDGTRRRFGLTVPADVPDAVSAVAWTGRMSKEQYLSLERAT